MATDTSNDQSQKPTKIDCCLCQESTTPSAGTCPACVAFKHLTEGTASRESLQALMEAIPKSTRERVLRRTRVSAKARVPSPEHKPIPKKKGNNNPIQGRGLKYRAGTAQKEQQNDDQRKSAAVSGRITEAVTGTSLGYGHVTVNQVREHFASLPGDAFIKADNVQVLVGGAWKGLEEQSNEQPK